MTAQELLSDVRALGVEIRVDGNYLRLRPKRVLTPELQLELREHKRELLVLLSPASSLGQVLGGVVEVEPSLCADDICEMPLEEFANAGYVVPVRPVALNEVVVLASDNATVDPGEKRVVYRAAELAELGGLGPESLESVHQLKKVFGGSVLPS